MKQDLKFRKINVFLIFWFFPFLHFSQQSSFKDHLSFEVGMQSYLLNFHENKYSKDLAIVSEFVGLNFNGAIRYHFNDLHSIGLSNNFFFKQAKEKTNVNQKANFFFTSLQLDYRLQFIDNLGVTLGVSIPYWEQYETLTFDMYFDDNYWQASELDYTGVDLPQRIGLSCIVPFSIHYTPHPNININLGAVGFLTEYKFKDGFEKDKKHYFFFASTQLGVSYNFGKFIHQKKLTE